MRLAKTFIALIVISAFSLSAQAQTPKIVWKNLQTNYERFQDIKPIIRNESNQPIYFDCSDNNYGSFVGYGYDGKFKLLKYDNDWNWNVMLCGFTTPEQQRRLTKQAKRIDKLKKQGKYIPNGCKLDPNQEYTIRFSDELWNYIIFGEGSAYYSYGAGKYKFTLEYEWANAPTPATAESPEFNVSLTENQNH